MSDRVEPRASGAPPWWRPDIHADRRPFLIGRNRIVAALRRHFDAEGFIEVDPCLLQHSPGNETHLHPFRTVALGNDLTPRELFLHTSPEFACKKLIAAGESRIVAFSHVFRNRERGPLHHPEFTMLEWYRTGETTAALIEDCLAIVRLAAEMAGTRVFRHAGHVCDPFAAPEILTVAEAFRIHAGFDLMETMDADGATDRDHLASLMTKAGLRADASDSWSDLFSRALVERIDPHLGVGRLTFLVDYPVAEAALARRKHDDRRLADRFELFAATIELANAFGELTDPEEQRARFAADMALKETIYGERVPIDEELLAALALMPETAGSALGLDRLVMLATGARRIEDVLWAPVPA